MWNYIKRQFEIRQRSLSRDVCLILPLTERMSVLYRKAELLRPFQSVSFFLTQFSYHAMYNVHRELRRNPSNRLVFYSNLSRLFLYLTFIRRIAFLCLLLSFIEISIFLSFSLQDSNSQPVPSHVRVDSRPQWRFYSGIGHTYHHNDGQCSFAKFGWAGQKESDDWLQFSKSLSWHILTIQDRIHYTTGPQPAERLEYW